MQWVWPEDELMARWSLAPEDLALVRGMADSGKLGLSAQLAFWRQHGRFPDDEADLAPMVLAHLAAQVGVAVGVLEGYEWAGRSGRRHRRMVLDHLAVAAFDADAEAILRRWLTDEVLPRELRPAAMEEEISAWFAHSRIVRPGAYRLDRIVRSTRVAYDDAALQSVAGRLRTLGLPRDVLRGLHPDQINRFHRRAAIETAWELRRHPERIRLPLLAFYCVPREGEVVDGLVELLIQVTHRITVKAERRVIEELVAEAQQVRGKAGILFRVAEAAVGQPDGVVREVIFPVAGQQTFEALAREAKALGTPPSRRIHTVVRASYGSYYRRMMPKLLAALDFRAYLKKLPDFEDVEAEERAMRHALGFRSFPAALDFFRGWPDQARAARLVLTRATEIDGNLYYLLDPAAELIEGKHPLAATLLRRAMIEDTLNGAKSSRYKHAARHLLECLSLASSIQDFGTFETHEAFASRLHAKHGRKAGFWAQVAELSGS